MAIILFILLYCLFTQEISDHEFTRGLTLKAVNPDHPPHVFVVTIMFLLSDCIFTQEIPDHEFTRGLKLEAVNPDHPAHICVATIVFIVEHLMWLHLDSSNKAASNHIVHVRSHDIFPVGWCESNDYPLRIPKKTVKRRVNNHTQIE